MNIELVKKLKRVFSNYITQGYIPDYFMNARLVLISKDGTSYPPLDKTRPISILPAITKLFELSIFNDLSKITKSSQFNCHQRGFVKGCSTSNNINDLLAFGSKHQKELYSTKSKTAFVFFDLKNTYDLVPRDKLYLKWEFQHWW